ncbi:MAG TPA: hypothetical protein VJS19_11250 [Candidatus Dormibacteraeota bacterium]|nr:hypothetical protein [Candidatus Dormibacteraeota bacterium]
MMDKSQVGRAGELAVELYALVTSGGELDIYSPVVDDDHVDLVAGIRGGPATLGIQVKTTPRVDRSGLVEARASYPLGDVREHPNFLYAVVLLDAVRIEAMWLIGSSDFNRLAYRIVDGRREVLEFRGRPSGNDAFQHFLIDPMQIGPAIITSIRKSPHAPQWLVALTAR